MRPSEINSYCGLIQLDFIEAFNNIRRKRFSYAATQLKKFIYGVNTINPVFALPIKTKNQQQKINIVERLSAKKIESRPIISGSIGRQPFWEREYGINDLKNSSQVDSIGFYVTNDPQLEDEKFIYLISTLKELLND